MESSHEPTPANVSTTALAALCDCQASFLSRHRADLPPALPVPSGPGRPQHFYDLGELARFALQLTTGLSEAECRLRLALIYLHRQGKRRACSFRVHALPDGGAELEPVRNLTDAEIRSLQLEPANE